MSLPFDRSESFSFDKAADEPCRYLQPAHGCAVHARLDEVGHGGCARYDCYGAGPRVVHELYRGRSWRSDARLARDIFEAFRRLRDVHELRFLLHETERLPLHAEHVAEREQLLGVLAPATGFSAQTLAALDVLAVYHDVHAFLRRLAPTTPRASARRRLALVR